MAEGTVEGVGVMAKLTAATAGGAVWGLFATAFLLVPAVFGALFAPVLRKTKETVDEKVNSISTSQPKAKAKGAKSKSRVEKDFEAKRAQLEDERRLAQLQEEMQRLSAKKSRQSAARSASAPTTI